MSKNKTLTLIFLSFLLISSLTVFTNIKPVKATAPTNLYENDLPPNTDFYNPLIGDTWAATAFTPSISHTLQIASFNLAATMANETGTVTAELRHAVDSMPQSTVLASSIRNISDITAIFDPLHPTLPMSWFNFTFSYDIASAVQYCFVLHSTNNVCWQDGNWSYTDIGGGYSYSRNGGVSFDVWAVSTMSFAEYGTPLIGGGPPAGTLYENDLPVDTSTSSIVTPGAVDLQSDSLPLNLAMHSVVGTFTIGMAFTPSNTHLLTYALFYMNATSVAESGTITCQLRQAIGSEPQATVLASQTININTISTTADWVSFSLNYVVTGGSQYCFVMNATNTVKWFDGNASYTGGDYSLTFDGGATWMVLDGVFSFKEYAPLIGALQISQSFTPQIDHTLKSVWLYLAATSVAESGYVTVTLKNASSSLPIGSALVSQTLALNTISTIPAWVQFNFTYTVQTGVQYCFVMNSTNNIQWFDGSAYSGGTYAYSFDGVAWLSGGGATMSFEEYGDPLPPNYPSTLNIQPLWNWLLTGNLLGFFQSLYLQAFGLTDILYACICLLFLIPVYVRSRNLWLNCTLWILLGSFTLPLMPAASPFAVILLIFGVAGILWRLVKPD